jgi:hypothetical protein
MNKILCPYCEYEFDKKPTRKRKCPNCGKVIYCSYKPNEKYDNKRYVTEKEYKEISKLWDNHNKLNEVLSLICWDYSFSTDREDYEARKKILYDEYIIEENIDHIIWKLLEEYADKYKNNLTRYIPICEQMNKILIEQGKEKIPMDNLYKLKFIEKFNNCLNGFKKGGIKKFKLLIIDDPDSYGNKFTLYPKCKEFEDKIYDVDEAINNNPFPCEGCIKPTCHPVIKQDEE